MPRPLSAPLTRAGGGAAAAAAARGGGRATSWMVEEARMSARTHERTHAHTHACPPPSPPTAVPEQTSTMIGTIFADPEIPIRARLHPHDRRFRAIHNGDHDGDINFCVRKVGAE